MRSGLAVPDEAYVVIPGERFGPIVRGSGRAALVEAFGDQHVVDVDVGVGEGFTVPGAEVRLGDASFRVIWEDPAGERIQSVQTNSPVWRTPEGIGVGTRLTDLEELAGVFSLAGFEWDYGGRVDLAGSKLARYSGTLQLTMYPEVLGPDFAHVIGDDSFSSADPHMVASAPKVVHLAISL